MKDTTIRRERIQATLNEALGPALAQLKAEGLDLSKPEHQRRTIRALVRIAAQDALARGIHPAEILTAAVEGLSAEVKATAGGDAVFVANAIN